MPEVDRSFVRDLRNMDRRLGVKFNGEHFVVTYDRGYGEAVNIFRIRADDGGFRQPNQHDLVVIKGGDLAEGPQMEARLREKAYAAEKRRERARQKAHDKIRDMTKDDKIYLTQKMGQITNQGKSNSAFRRIDPKRSKNTVAVIP